MRPSVQLQALVSSSSHAAYCALKPDWGLALYAAILAADNSCYQAVDATSHFDGLPQ